MHARGSSLRRPSRHFYAQATRFDPQHLDTALHHCRESIHYATTAGNTYGAGQTRYNAALLLANNGRTQEALAWANAALRDFQTVGAGAQAKIDKARALIAELNDRLSRRRTPPIRRRR